MTLTRSSGRPSAGTELMLNCRLDEDVGQLAVGGDPGVLDVVGQGVAQDGGKGADEVLADDGVLLGLDEERGVLVGDALDGAAQGRQVVNVRGVGKDGVGEGCLLRARVLVAHREDVEQLRVRAEHGGIEGGGDGAPVLLDDGRRRLDDGDLLCRERHCGAVEVLLILLLLLLVVAMAK